MSRGRCSPARFSRDGCRLLLGAPTAQLVLDQLRSSAATATDCSGSTLLSALSRADALGGLERAAKAEGDERWDRALDQLGCLASPTAAARRDELRGFLAAGPEIGLLAAALL